ncbi:MAG: alpha-mannosidase, partial [Draconibacterium sp.]|nr:alpha-mannosidase [Draconibacterium sp.]
GFMYGCTSSNWPTLAKFAKENDLLFIPCPGPGYIDTRIRPWNVKNTEDREDGKYYERMFMNAVNVSPSFIGITSFNEWHEGTQIEPAIPKKISTFTYEDYGKDTDPLFYIKKTRELVDKYIQ